ncbi:Unknown protein [Striga hermonthica]|uniref:F-box domain-containing protein n=1 Tax=Striga hermonthica TaxID=68872 RepID=A0A9N7MLB4_STRHE|nr:Unknown protein [Striga hermonthica]
MAKFPSSVFRQPPAEVEAHGIAEGVCAHKNLLISIPDDVLLKILLNLSAQDIYRASLVCRRLYYLTIRSEDFVNLHLQQQTDEYGLFFQYGPTSIYDYSYPRSVFVSMKQGHVTVSDHYAYKSRLILQTSCNGLILDYKFWKPFECMFWKPFQLHLANPVTGRAFRLPPLPKGGYFTHCCMGYAKASKAYKVVLAYRIDWESDACLAILTVGVDKSWRHLDLATDQYLTEYTLSRPLVTEGFIHLIFGGIVVTLNVETEVMSLITETQGWTLYPEYMKWYLSTGKSLTLVVQVEDCVFQVWEMVCGDYYQWRKWERQIMLGSEIQYLRSIQPVGWLQQMEVLVFKGRSDVFYVVIATGEIGWITSSEEIHGPVLPHKNTLVNPFTV